MCSTYYSNIGSNLDMLEMNLNPHLADLLKRHGVNISIDDQFIKTDLVDNVKFKARAVYHETDNSINSRLDVMALTDKGEQIIECCGDYGKTIEEASNRNFQNFSSGSLHPLLAAFKCKDPHVIDQVTVEEWTINEKSWEVFIGNIVPKVITSSQNSVAPPRQFFKSIEQGIHAQKLTNRLHWFRSYYSQLNDEITNREFLMDNDVVKDTDNIFRSLPIMPQVKFYSCRNFIVLKKK